MIGSWADVMAYLPTLGYACGMSLVEQDALVIVPASVRSDPSWDSEWATTVLKFVERATRQGMTVTMQADERMYTPREAAEVARVSRMTIQRRIDDGTIKASKRGSHWRIAESELDRYRDQVFADTAAGLANDF